MGNSTIITNIIFIVIIAAMIVFMWMSSRRQRKQQQAEATWREHLKTGEKVSTVSGLLGTVVKADPAHDQITIKSGTSETVWRIQAVRRPPIIPKYADEDKNTKKDGGEGAATLPGEKPASTAPAKNTATTPAARQKDGQSQREKPGEAKEKRL